MVKRTFQSLLIACLVTGALWAANNPFVGEWKLNPSKSQLTDEMKVKAAGTNKYALDLGGGRWETVAADGTEQPGLFGTTLSITVEGPQTWKVVRKKHGRPLVTGIWRLSEDGTKLSDTFTAYQPNGSTLRLNYVYKRTTPGSGFVGTWESTSEKVNSVFQIVIRSYKNDGLSFVNPAQEATTNMKFDGKDYMTVGPNVPAGAVSSGRRVNESTLEITDKMKDKVTDTRQLDLSPDLKTLTMTVHAAGQTKPNVLVFDRE
jgi:hypothetical protein